MPCGHGMHYNFVPVAGDRKENKIPLLFVTKTGVATVFVRTRARTRI